MGINSGVTILVFKKYNVQSADQGMCVIILVQHMVSKDSQLSNKSKIIRFVMPLF